MEPKWRTIWYQFLAVCMCMWLEYYNYNENQPKLMESTNELIKRVNIHELLIKNTSKMDFHFFNWLEYFLPTFYNFLVYKVSAKIGFGN